MDEQNGQSVLADLIRKMDEEPDNDEVSGIRGIQPGDDVVELGNNFSFDGFQVVRREFFAHLREPAATFSSCKFSVNSACLSKFPETDYVQVLVNQDTKIMALRPCEDGARDSFMWCSYSKGKRKSKSITCKLFFAKIVDLMKWNPDYRYKLLGRLIHANGEYLIAFDLTATEVYLRTIEEGKKPKNSRIPVFPSNWQNQFGLPYEEHRQSMQINLFDGYAVFAIKEKAGTGAAMTAGNSDSAVPAPEQLAP